MYHYLFSLFLYEYLHLQNVPNFQNSLRFQILKEHIYRQSRYRHLLLVVKKLTHSLSQHQHLLIYSLSLVVQEQRYFALVLIKESVLASLVQYSQLVTWLCRWFSAGYLSNIIAY